MKDKELQNMLGQVFDPGLHRASKHNYAGNEQFQYMSPLINDDSQDLQLALNKPEKFAKDMNAYVKWLEDEYKKNKVSQNGKSTPGTDYKFLKIREHMLLDKLKAEYNNGYLPEKTIHVTEDREVIIMFKRLKKEEKDGKRSTLLHD